MHGCRGISWHLARNFLLTLGLVIAISCAFFYLAFVRDYVNETWPNGKTKEIRSEVEALLPTPQGTEFVNVRLHFAMDLPYTESIFYLSDRSETEILDYYGAMLEKYGWSVSIDQRNVRDNYPPSLHARDHPFKVPTVVPLPSPQPNGDVNQVSYDTSYPDPTVSLGVYFWPIGTTREKAKFTYMVSSDSLEQAAKVLAAGR